MALTTKEIELVASLRQKMGDLSTRVVVVADVDTTIYVEGVESVAVTADVNKITWDTSKQIWSDAEYVNELNDALLLVYKGSKASLEVLSDLEELIVILAARIELNLQLANDSVRYVTYTALAVTTVPVSPAEFINLAKHLEKKFDKLIAEVDDEDLGNVIQQTEFRIVDRHEQLIMPTDYSPPQKIPEFTLTEVDGAVEIFIPYTFINDYSSHYIRKTGDGSTNLYAEYYTLEEKTITDDDVVAGQTYTYELFVQSMNNVLVSQSLSITIDYPVDVSETLSIAEDVTVTVV